MGRVSLPLLAALASLTSAGHSAANSGPFVSIDGSRFAAKLVGVTYDSTRPEDASFRFAVGEVEREEDWIVRWGSPLASRRGAAVVLADGSRLVTDRPWSASGYLRIDDNKVSLHRKSGWVTVPREAVAAVVVEGDSLGEERPAAGDDVVRTVDGDRLEGAVVELNRVKLSLRVAGSDDPIAVPLSRVAAVSLSGPRSVDATDVCLVGLADGSLLRATELRVAEGGTTLATPSGLRLRVDADDVVFLQPLGGPVEYLSDREADDYRHTPYFDFLRGYGRDRGVDGGPLSAASRRSVKGVSVWSAARLVYRLDGGPRRFQAEAAIADATEPGLGSVVFRVYLVRGGDVAVAYESPIIRGGDAPAPIDVDATGAAALVLVVDYADGGDAGDHALWLDARLVDAAG